MSAMGADSYQILRRNFLVMIVPHATQQPQLPSDAARAAATEFCQQVAVVASEHGRGATGQMLLLVLYHELFNVGPCSEALLQELPR